MADNKQVANIDQQRTRLRNIIESKQVKDRIMQTIARGLSAEKVLRLTLFACNQQPKLLECEPMTIVASMMQAARLGLEPDGGLLGHGYLVPFWSGRNRRMECQFIAGYRGLCKLARNSGEVADISAEVVYEADRFSYTMGLEPKLEHTRNDDATDSGELTHAYAIARFRNGEKKFIVLNRREVEKIKGATSSKDREGNIVGPWKEWESEMWKKTAVRRLSKLLPLSVESATVIQQDEDRTGEATVTDFTLPELPEVAELPRIEEPTAKQTVEISAAEMNAEHVQINPPIDASEPTNEPDPGEVMEAYVRALAGSRTLAEAGNAQETFGGPDCVVDWTPAERTQIHQMYSRRCDEIRAAKANRAKQKTMIDAAPTAQDVGE